MSETVTSENVNQLDSREAKTSHTPGPWFVVNNGQYLEVCVSPEQYSKSIAETCSSKVSFGAEVERANAQLIAAAPELLECLKDAVHAAQQRGDCVFVHTTPQWVLDARKAIAKAEGNL